MPYKTRKVGDEYCVYKKQGGKKVGCTKGTEKAKKKYLAALHIADESVNIDSFKVFFESTHENIEDLKRMIQNPDPERVKQYGGTAYVDMLKKKLDRMLKIVAIKDHLKKSPLSKSVEDNESRDLEQQILNLINQNKKEEAKKLNFKMYDINPDKYKDLYYKITGSEKESEEDAEDRCKRKADQVYGKKTSAYKSGAIVRCRKGKIWKKK